MTGKLPGVVKVFKIIGIDDEHAGRQKTYTGNAHQQLETFFELFVGLNDLLHGLLDILDFFVQVLDKPAKYLFFNLFAPELIDSTQAILVTGAFLDEFLAQAQQAGEAVDMGLALPV